MADDEGRGAGVRLFPSDLTPGERRVYGAVLAFYLATTVGLVWPAYAAFADIRPLVLGVPFSLFYVVLWVVASFLVLLGVYLWEDRRERDEGAPDAAGASGKPGPAAGGRAKHGPEGGSGPGSAGGREADDRRPAPGGRRDGRGEAGR